MGESNLLELKEKLISFVKEKKVVTIILIVGIAGMVLILFSELFSSKNTSSSSTSTDTQAITMTEYEKRLEEKINTLVKEIEGVGKVTVMVTIESGSENIYATEEKTSGNTTNDGSESGKTTNNNTYEESVVLINGQKEALIEKVIEPKIRGVVIVCEGGSNSTVKQQVTQAITTAFAINANKVCITQSGS